MENKLLLAGKIVNTHGIRGEVKIFPYCDSAEFLQNFKNIYIDNKSVKVLSSRVHKNMFLAKLENITAIEDAEVYIGKEIFINKNDITLEKGRYFIDDLIGLSVIDLNTKKVYGKVKNIIQTGANDVFEVYGDRQYLVPKIDSVVKEIDFKNKKIMITPLDGLFD